MEKLFLTTAEVIEMTRIKRTTLLQMAYRGEIPSIRVGGKRLWPAVQIQEWFDRLVSQQLRGSAGHGGES